MPEAKVLTTINKRQVFLALVDMTVDSKDFDHRGWSIYEAEVLERAANLIRDGYAEDKANREQAKKEVEQPERQESPGESKARDVAHKIWVSTIGRGIGVRE